MKIKYHDKEINLDVAEIASETYDAMVPEAASGYCHLTDDGNIRYDTLTQGTYIPNTIVLYAVDQNACANADLGPEDLLDPNEYDRLLKKYGDEAHWRDEDQVNSITGGEFQERLKTAIIGDLSDPEIINIIYDEIERSIDMYNMTSQGPVKLIAIESHDGQDQIEIL